MLLIGAPDPERPVDVARLRARLVEHDALDDAALARRVRAEFADQLAPAFAADDALADRLTADRMASPRDMQARAIAGYATRGDLCAAAAGVRCPAVLMTGEHDRVSPPAAAGRMAAALNAPAVSIIPGCGHYATAEDPDRVASMVRAALASLAPQTGI